MRLPYCLCVYSLNFFCFLFGSSCIKGKQVISFPRTFCCYYSFFFHIPHYFLFLFFLPFFFLILLLFLFYFICSSFSIYSSSLYFHSTSFTPSSSPLLFPSSLLSLQCSDLEIVYPGSLRVKIQRVRFIKHYGPLSVLNATAIRMLGIVNLNATQIPWSCNFLCSTSVSKTDDWTR